MTEEGMVYVVDRLKRAIIVDGQRVFPFTIERVLLKSEAVNKCAVVGDKTGKLFAHVVLCSGCTPDTVRPELARLCEADLPKYELPTEYIFRDALPLTPVDKVDFRALEKQAAEMVSTASEHVDSKQ